MQKELRNLNKLKELVGAEKTSSRMKPPFNFEALMPLQSCNPGIEKAFASVTLAKP